MKKYFFYILSLVLAVSCLEEERSPEEILVPSLTQVECSDASMMLTSKVPSGSEKLIQECGFFFSKDKSMADARKIEGELTGNYFTAELPDRTYGSTYYITSYVTNGHGSEIRSDVSTYELKSFDKYIDFQEIERVSFNKLAKTAEVIFEVKIWGGVNVSEVGVYFDVTSDNPSKREKHKAGTLSENGSVSVTLKGFESDVQYYLWAYVKDGDNVAYGSITPMLIKTNPPTVSNAVVSEIGSNSALFSSTVTDNGGDTVSEVGFYYDTKPEVDPTSFKINLPFSEGTFSLTAQDLLPNTIYYVKSFAVNSAGSGYGQVVNFKTIAAAPSVTTLGVTDITETSALLSGNVVSDNGADVTERGFVWLQGTEIPTIESFKIKAEGTVGEYSVTLDQLEPNKTYTFRAYAINAKGTSLGDAIKFTSIAGLPSLASETTVSEITSTSAKFASTVTDHGGDTVSEIGFYYGTSSDISQCETISAKYSTNSFTMTVSGLSVGTKYYVTAFARNSVGEVHNTVVTFETTGIEPSVQTVGATDITSSSVILSGEVLSENGEPITDSGFMWMKGNGNPTASSNKASVGRVSAGEFSKELTNLEPNQTYSYKAYAVNAKGTGYGEVKTFTTSVALPEVDYASVGTRTSTSAVLSATVLSHGGKTVSEVGFLYGTTSSLDPSTASKVRMNYSSDSYSITISGLTRATEYYVQPYATNSAGTAYGNIISFETLPELPSVTTSDVTDITETTARSGGVITDDGGEVLAKGVVWGKTQNLTTSLSTKTNEGGGSSSFTSNIYGLEPGNTYYVRAYVTNSQGTSYGETITFNTAGELQSISLPASNSFIVSESGAYSFNTVKGNSSESVGYVDSVEVLWESFGTAEMPNVGDLIQSVSFTEDKIIFETADPFREGNAVIAAKDEFDTILWSWHIWLTDEPEEHIYNNGAGTMMDRNLGATSAMPGDVGALGLLYQWGRKDPFLNSSSISSDDVARSTIEWPSPVHTDQTYGTMEYATSHPTTFITNSGGSYFDWCGSDDYIDDSRWQSEKTIYDPCPAGWRVPDGGDNGIWRIAGFEITDYDNVNHGLAFGIESHSSAWYPTSGYLYHGEGRLACVSYSGQFWSVTPSDGFVHNFMITSDVQVILSNRAPKSDGQSVRCYKEGSRTYVPQLDAVTYDADNVTTNSAVLYGEVVADKVSKIVERGFVWIEGDAIPTLADNKMTVDGDRGYFSAELNGLKSNQMYSYRAYVIGADAMTSYGGTHTFITQMDIVPDEPSDPSNKATVAIKIINEGGGREIAINDVEFRAGSDISYMFDVPYTILLPMGTSETLYMEVEPFELRSGTMIYIHINGATKSMRLSEDVLFEPGKIVTFDVPIKALEYPTHSNVFDMQSADSPMFKMDNVVRQMAQINGEEIEVYILPGGSSQKVTINGTSRDIVNALDVNYYVASFKDKPSAMTIEGLNFWMPEFDSGGNFTSHVQFAKYSPLSSAIKAELGTFIGALVLPALQALLANGLSRSNTYLGLTEIMDPRKITFNNIIESNVYDEAQLSDMIIIDEEPFHRGLRASNINSVLASGLTYSSYIPTVEGMRDLANGNSTIEAENTAYALYYSIKNAVGDKSIEYSGYKLKLSVCFDALFNSPEDFAKKFGDMKFEIVLSTFPYTENLNDYGTRENPITPSAPYNPVILWGINSEHIY